MKKESFFKLMNEYKIDINKLGLYIQKNIGEKGLECTEGISDDGNGKWRTYWIDERQNVMAGTQINEEEAFDELFVMVKMKLERKGVVINGFK
jgi:hypothetical protein